MMPAQATILIVDDKLENLDVLIAYLEKFDFRFLVARNGEEMFKRIAHVLPDLILLDILMPGMNGFEACRQLKNQEEYKDIPVIFMTALSDTLDKVKGFELGAVDYITKPFQQAEVLARIKTHLTIQGLKRELQIKNAALQEALDRERTLLENLRINLSTALPHELRTPLTGITGFAKLLTDPHNLPNPEKIVKFGNHIYQNALRLQRLIENAILYANLKVLQSTSKQGLPWQNETLLHVQGLIASVARQCAQDAKRPEDLRLDLTDAHLRASHQNVEKILTELLHNAFKFSKSGTPVHVTTASEEQTYTLQIHDQGCGMSAEQIATIGAYIQFNRHQHEQQGIGLGLIIACLLTQLEGGTYSIESKPEQGTTVTLVFEQTFEESP